jgi:putative FmdB family regulatory protein
MPIYQAECNACQAQFEYHSSIANCLDVPKCGLCQSSARKVILSAPLGFVHGKFEPFKSMIDGTTITTNRELKEHNVRNGVMNLNEIYTEREILEGKMHERKIESQAKEIVEDIRESVHALNNGYKPTIGTEDEL